jgi:hypothetical protein
MDRNITPLQLFAAMAPMPDDHYISTQMKIDKNRNPYNEGGKPKLRDSMEIIADYKIAFARLMLDKTNE